jgi:hypothetical protein
MIDLTNLTYTQAEVEEIQDRFFREGYSTAVHDFGIWKDGVQRIGYLETPIKEVLSKRFPGSPLDVNLKSILDNK